MAEGVLCRALRMLLPASLERPETVLRALRDRGEFLDSTALPEDAHDADSQVSRPILRTL
jgi:hypothetical protein